MHTGHTCIICWNYMYLTKLLNDTTDNVNQYKREIEEDDDDLYFDYLKVELDMSIKVKDHIELLFD